MENLIYDRTQQDINDKTEKGRYNYTDLNRVESWCEYLANLLNSYSYSVSILTKQYTMKNKANESDLERIRTNIEQLKKAYISITAIPKNLEYMTWQKANAIEKILYEINRLIENMIASFYYSNTFYSGESEGLM